MPVIKRNWATWYTLWVEYRGVSDEYVSLKTKWNYITCSEKNGALPSMNSTFNRMDRLIADLAENFKPMFTRDSNDTLSGFKEDLAETKLNEVRSKFFSLAHYLGILKFVFYQRTVSYGLRDVVSGLPLSPERTMGNEAIYLAADHLAKRYFDCLHPDPYLQWDGAVSFFYPVQEDYFFGGLSWPDPHLRQTHFVLSEENKHFLGSLLILAHEAAHTTQIIIQSKDVRPPNWLIEIVGLVHGNLVNNSKSLVEEVAEKCKGCYVTKWLKDQMNVNNYFYTIVENLADLLALYIGGPTTSLALIDIVVNQATVKRYFPNRPAFLLGYCEGRGMQEKAELSQEISKMREGWKSCLQINYPRCKQECDCYTLMLKIGEYTGKVFAEFETYVLTELGSDRQTKRIFPREATSLTQGLVKEKFLITDDDEQRITETLNRLKICPEEDPRHIIHCYYRTFRKGQPLDFATVLCSLAYNTHKK